MIVKAPCCEIKTFPGEIGQGTLDLSKESYYGVPRIKYHTAKGDITLFPHEVMPASREEMELCLLEGGVMTKDGRYMPSKATLDEIADCFGHRVGLNGDWEKHYEELFA